MSIKPSKVNIVLTVRDRYLLTEQTLRTLFATTTHDRFNLTIVDDGSTDFRVKRMLDSYAGRYDNVLVVSLSRSKHVLAWLKNLGVELSQKYFGRAGDYLCLIDNDVAFLDGWLDRMTEAFEENMDVLALLGGQQHPYHHPIGIGTDCFTRLVTEYESLPGTHWFMPWATWVLAGPLQSITPGVCKGEDVLFCSEIRRRMGHIGALTIPCVVDCGHTNSDGNPAPGAEIPREKIPGIYYE